MRQTTALIGVLVGALCLPGMARAEMKIGYLDVTRVAEESPQYQTARKALQGDLERRESDLRAMAEQLKAKEEKMQRDASVLSDGDAKKMERDVVALRRKLQNSRDEFRDELAMRQNEERAKLLRQVSEVVKSIGKEEGFDLILTEGVAYYSKTVDVSDRVLARLKQTYKSR